MIGTIILIIFIVASCVGYNVLKGYLKVASGMADQKGSYVIDTSNLSIGVK